MLGQAAFSEAPISDIVSSGIVPVFPPVISFLKFNHPQPQDSLRYYVNRRKAEQASGPVWVQLPYKPKFLGKPILTEVSKWYVWQDPRKRPFTANPTVRFDAIIIEALVAVNPPTRLDGVLQEVLVKVNPTARLDAVITESLSKV